MVTRLLIATTNPNKIREIRRLLADVQVELLALDAFPAVPEPEETGDTFQANARLKAAYYAAALEPQLRTTPALVVAEDSGLQIDALDGEPGVHSARFLGADASYPDRFAEIFRRLDAHRDVSRSARFVCALAVVHDGRAVFETTGTIDGEIAAAPSGTLGFGYDPIFLYPPYGRTLAEVSEEDKLRVAHRGRAFRQLAVWIRNRV